MSRNDPAPRSYLFVPGNRPDRFDKAMASGADICVLDLEDAVAPPDKAAARDAITRWLDTKAAAQIALRINAAGSEWFGTDLRVCAHPAVRVVLLPKAEASDEIAAVAQAAPQVSVLPIVESVAGIDALRELAAAPGVQRLALGTLDLAIALDLALDERSDQTELATFRSLLVLASRRADIAAPVDGVTTALDDEALLLADTLRARRFGFGAKLCIHPRQVAVVHRAFAPSPEQVAWAGRVVAAVRTAHGGAVQVDGRMVDRPVLLQAEAILARAVRG